MSHGPGTLSVQLEEGCELLAQSKEQIRRFNRIREENVLAEKLFNLPISKFPELVTMEEMNKRYDLIYNIYKEYVATNKEFCLMSFWKMDPVQLKSAAAKFLSMVKKLGNKHAGIDQMFPFTKLRDALTGFDESIPLIEMLRNPAVKERHWKRILEDTGKSTQDFNIKTMTLGKVFELELQHFEDKVQEITVEAGEEERNEQNLQQIEEAWKKTNFEIGDYKLKGSDQKGYVLKSPDEIRQILEDNILILQSLSASKYVRSIKDRVARWEKDLNIISDVIDIWMITQNKWKYLESIFSSDDIKMQLPEEAKKFGRTDASYKKIMESANHSTNVLHNCCKVDGGSRLDDLKNISTDLDKCQKSLSNYLETKQQAFPRFYFISQDDLLQILGSSNPKAIQPFLLGLFDNCKRLTFGKGDKQILGMVSDEGEEYSFETPVKPEGSIEDWMNKIDEEMKSSLNLITKKATFNYAKTTDRLEWIKGEIGMVAVVGT
jgi:dynein heavy chain